MLEDNKERQQDEINILKSIYNELNILTREINENEIIIEIKLNSLLLFRAILNSNYPSNNPPQIELIGRDLTIEFKNKAYEYFNELFQINKGEVVLYDCIEWIKENMNSTTTSSSSSLLSSTTTTSFQNNNSNNSSQSSNTTSFQNIHNSNYIEQQQQQQQQQYELEILNEQYSNTLSEAFHDIYHGETLIDRKSVFQAHVASISSVEDAKNILAILKTDRKIARATHNMYAYRLSLPSTINGMEPIQIADNDDDGEDAAGPKLAQLLSLMNVTNIIVVVSRWYGGIQLGPDRFRHIANVARIAIESSGLGTRQSNNNNNNNNSGSNKKSHYKKK